MNSDLPPEMADTFRVFFHATSDAALKSVDMSDLRKFSADGENVTGSERRGASKNPAKPIHPDAGGDKQSAGNV